MSLGKIGKYELLEKLSAGGMGELFRARIIGPGGFERIVALKTIRKEAAGDQSFVNMFIAEAKVASLLSHQNLVHLYDFGSDGDGYFLAMEMVEGQDLAKVLKRTRADRAGFPLAVAVYVGREVARGLDFLHRVTRKGEPLRLIHRDVSPQNIMLSYDGAVKLTDFGIVRMSSRGRVTRLGVVKGKAGYLSPEQVMDRPIDARSDLFSLGIVLWESLTGGRLFQGGSDLEIISQTLQRPIRPPSALNSEVPPELDAVVMKALAREREARFSSASEMARALEGLAGIGSELDATQLMRARFPESVQGRTLGLSSSVALIPAEASEVRKFLGFPPELPVMDGLADGPAHDPVGQGRDTKPERGELVEAVPVVNTLAAGTTAPLSSDEMATAPRPKRARRPRLIAGAAALVCLGVAGWMGWRGSSPAALAPAAAVVAPAEAAPRPPPEPARELPALPPVAAAMEPEPKETPIGVAPEAAKAPEPAASKPLAVHKRPLAAYGQVVATAVQPWAEVIVDGHPRHWFSAGRWRVPAGHHQITLSNPQAGIERRFDLELPPGGVILFTGDLKSLQPRSEE